MKNNFTSKAGNVVSGRIKVAKHGIEPGLITSNKWGIPFFKAMFLLVMVLLMKSAGAQAVYGPVLCGGYNPVCISSGQSATLCTNSYDNYYYNGQYPYSTSYTWQYSTDGSNWYNTGSGGSSLTTSTPAYYRYIVNATYQLSQTGWYYQPYECGYYYDCGYYYSCGIFNSQSCYQPQTCYHSQTCYQYYQYTNYYNQTNTYYSQTYQVTAANPTASSIVSSLGTNTCIGVGQTKDLTFSVSGNFSSVNWTVPSWMTILSGQGTSQITVRIFQSQISGSTAAGNIYATPTISSCNGTTQNYTFIANVTPNVQPIGGSSSVCVGNSTSLTESLTGGTWSSNNTLVASVNSAGLVTGNSAGNATITYAATSNGCSASVSKLVTVNPKPSVSVTVAGNGTACPGSTVALHANTTAGSSYVWLKDGVSIPEAVNLDYNATTSGSYTAIVTNSNGCVSGVSNAITVTIADVTAPVPPVLADIVAECSATVPVPVASDACSGDVSGTTTQSLTYTEQGTYVINWTFTDPSGNSSTASQNVIIKDITPPSITCNEDISVLGTSAAGAVVTYNTPVGTDNCSGATTVMTEGLASGSTFPIGTTKVTFTVTDIAGATASCSFNVTVTGLAPQIVSPGDISVANDAGQCGAAVSFAATETTGIPASTITYSINPGTVFPAGTTSVVATATNAVGVSSCTFNVTVTDNEKPVITAPFEYSVPNDPGKCGADIPFIGTPVTSDNCGVLSVSNDHPSSYYPVGTTIVTWTVTDVNGNVSDTVHQSVTVIDNELPVITAPASISVNNDAGNCSALVALGTPVTTDNCGVASVTNDAPEIFPVGTTVVTWTVTDMAGYTATATQSVTVADNEKPNVITQDITVQLDANGNAAITASQINNGSTDNCGIASFSLDKTSFSCSDYGSNTVTLTVTDTHGNSSSATATVNVVDLVPPAVITQNTTIYLDAAGTASVTAAAINNGSVDACGIASVVLDKTSFNCSNAGDNTVTLTVTDSHGNVSSATAVVTVKDNIAPSVVTKNITIQLNASGSASIAAADVNNGSSDNCGIQSLSVSPNVFGCSNVGTNTVTLTVTDKSGNISTGSAIVTVQDKTAPVVITKNITVNLDGTGNVTVAAADVDNGSSDACGIKTMTVSPNSFNCSKLGANTVTLTVTDVNGNVSSKTAVVTVQDKLGPVPTVAVLPTVSGQCSARIIVVPNNWWWFGDGDDDDDDAYYMTAPTAKDNCSGLVTGTTTDPLKYSVQGTYTIHWKFVDANGNVTIQPQTVIVKDNIAPKPWLTNLPTISGQCSVNIGSYDSDWWDDDDNDDYGIAAPWAWDNCAGWIRGTTTDPLSYNSQGTYTIHWTFSDGHGNITVQNQTVIVKDQIKPKIKDLKDVTVSCGSNTDPSVTGTPTATDNCSTPVVGHTDVVNGNKITRTWTATDAAGNTATSVQVITIVDNVKPVITDVADKIVNCGGSTDPSATGIPTATDNCSTPVISHTDAVNGNVITRTWKATDAAGNTATSVQTITIGSVFSTGITSVPSSSIYTGGVSTNLYLGYGSQSTTLQTGSLPAAGAPYSYAWSGTTNLLNSTTASAPLFTPVSAGSYQFTVTVTNKYGCKATAAISICVNDIRVAGTSGATAKVYVCHTPNGKNAVSQTLQVLTSQVPAHIGNNTCGSNGNDRLGSCDQTPCNTPASSSTGNPITSAVKAETGTAVSTEEELKVTVMPNPSSTYFTLKLESKFQTPVEMRVMDGNGRVIDAKSAIGSNSTIQVGHNYSSGIYYAEFVQGTKRNIVQLVKVK